MKRQPVAKLYQVYGKLLLCYWRAQRHLPNSMMRSILLRCAVFTLLVGCLISCPEIRFTWGEGGQSVALHQISQADSEMLLAGVQYTGRATYISPEGYALLHRVDGLSGLGSWQFRKGSNMLAVAVSFAVSPHLVDSAYFTKQTSLSGWRGVAMPMNITVECTDATHSLLFLQSSQHQPDLTGFYVKHSSSPSTSPLFRQITTSTGGKPKYLFPLLPAGNCQEGTGMGCEVTWLVGDEPFVDAGLAFTKVAHADSVTDAVDELVRAAQAGQLRWQFVATVEDGGVSSPWVEDAGARLITAELGEDPYLALERERRLITQIRGSAHPETQGRQDEDILRPAERSLQLGNGISIPHVGLGTGGIWAEQAPEVFKDALQMGYRLFDLAREYRNEHIMGAALRQSGVDRREVFLQTKVWPTQLGFEPTSRAIATSLRELGVAYIDHYMLHWPRCDADVEWMRCWDVEDPAATWRESYRALERAYAEGRVRSIGVSNFDLPLLRELEESVATVLPHIVQNWAEPGRTDEAVRDWCDQHGAIYQPYAPLRNLHLLGPDLRATLQAIADQRNTTEHTVVLQFFLQLGSSAIPRSTRRDHLEQNLQPRDWSLSDEEMRLLMRQPRSVPDL